MMYQGGFTPAVSVDDFKRAADILPEEVANDAAYRLHLDAAEDVVTTASATPLTPRTLTLTFPGNCGHSWLVPVRPVTNIVQIEYLDDDDVFQTVTTSGVALLRGDDEPRLRFAVEWWDALPRADVFRVTLGVGLSEGNANGAALRNAIILLAKEWFDANSDLEEMRKQPITFGFERLIRQQRYRRPFVYRDETDGSDVGVW